MVGGISGLGPYISTSYQYMGYGRVNGVPQGASAVRPSGSVKSAAAAGEQSGHSVDAESGTSSVRDAAAAGIQPGQSVRASAGVRTDIGIGAAMAAGRAASPGTPVQPVSPVSAVEADAPRGIGYMIPFLREGMDPAELAVRMRIRYVSPAQNQGTGNVTPGGSGENEAAKAAGTPGETQPVSGVSEEAQGESGVKSAQEVMEEGECQTCKERKYQDGSDDAGVSFKTPTRIAPEQAASAVRGHEMEHVVRERAAAEREDRQVVSQSVTIHTAICPECGKAYISGGTTRTTTASDPQPEQTAAQQQDRGFSAAA